MPLHHHLLSGVGGQGDTHRDSGIDRHMSLNRYPQLSHILIHNRPKLNTPESSWIWLSWVLVKSNGNNNIMIISNHSNITYKKGVIFSQSSEPSWIICAVRPNLDILKLSNFKGSSPS